MSGDRTIAKNELTVLLSSALGEEKSDEVVAHAARDLGCPGTMFSADEARAIFERLSTAEGLVGVVARFAVTRGDVEKLMTKARASSQTRAAAPARDSRDAIPSSQRIPVGFVDLLSLLAPALGAEKARDATEAAAARIGVDAHRLTPDDALRVLEVLASSDGIVGVVARFAKARFLLRTGD